MTATDDDTITIESPFAELPKQMRMTAQCLGFLLQAIEPEKRERWAGAWAMWAREPYYAANPHIQPTELEDVLVMCAMAGLELAEKGEAKAARAKSMAN